MSLGGILTLALIGVCVIVLLLLTDPEDNDE